MKCPYCHLNVLDKHICPLRPGVSPITALPVVPAQVVPAQVVPAQVAPPMVVAPEAPSGLYEFLSHPPPEEISYPQIDPTFIVPVNVAEELSIAEKLSAKHPINILVTGQPGGGKTSMIYQFAARCKRPCVVVDFGLLQEPQELFHSTRLQVNGQGSQTDIRESAFVKGIETPRCVVGLDELNRPENERVLNPLLPFLDGRRQSYIDYLRRIVRVADGVIIIATLNEGGMFCGVSSIDVALRDRFRELHLPYLPPAEEIKVLMAKTGVPQKIAFMLVDFTARVRKAESIEQKVSTRQILSAAENYAAGDQLWRAVSTSIGHFNDMGWRQQIMEVLSFCIQDETEKKAWEVGKNDPRYVQL